MLTHPLTIFFAKTTIIVLEQSSLRESNSPSTLGGKDMPRPDAQQTQMIAKEPHTPLLLFGGFESAVLVIRAIARAGVSPRTGVSGEARGEAFARGSGTTVGVGSAANHGIAHVITSDGHLTGFAGAGPRDRPLVGPPGEGGCRIKRLGGARGAANALV